MSGRTLLLVTPPYHCGVVEVAGTWMPLGLAYLAGAARRAGWEPVIYDAMSKGDDHQRILQRVASLRPDVLATSAITATFPDALQLLKNAKERLPEITTVMGGVHPTFMDREVLTAEEGVVDYVVRGEGEETLAELLLCIDGGTEPHQVRGLSFQRDGEIVRTEGRPFHEDLDRPEAAWDLLDWEDYRYFVIPGSRLAVVSTSRGCSFSCTFCSQQKFYKQSWRGRDPARAADEILMLKRDYGANVFLVADEYPTSDQARWLEFLDRLHAASFDGHLLMETRAADIVRDAAVLHRYKRAGVIHVYVGLEATDQQALDSIHKELSIEESIQALRLLHEHGLVSETSFVLGFPHETAETIAQTLATAQRYDPDFAHFLAIAPWPYADIYAELEPHIAVRDYRKYNLVDPVVKPRALSLQDVDRHIMDCYRRFYMGKLQQLAADPDPFRRRYLLISMQLMMRSSFLATKVGGLGDVPLEVKRLLAATARLLPDG